MNKRELDKLINIFKSSLLNDLCFRLKQCRMNFIAVIDTLVAKIVREKKDLDKIVILYQIEKALLEHDGICGCCKDRIKKVRTAITKIWIKKQKKDQRAIEEQAIRDEQRQETIDFCRESILRDKKVCSTCQKIITQIFGNMETL